MKTTATAKQVETRSRRDWTRPAVKSAGTVGEILKGGNGKLTIITGDPGEPQKVPAMDV